MATPVTITSALAELKLITKRLDRKKDFVRSFLWRQEIMTDPLERQGGSIEAIKRTLQAIGDAQRVALVAYGHHGGELVALDAREPGRSPRPRQDPLGARIRDFARCHARGHRRAIDL